MAASVSKLEIIRRAASKSGSGYIDTIDDDSDVSQQTRDHYDSIAEDMLTSSPWRFARKVALLSRLDLTPEKPWETLYQKPPDCLAVWFLSDGDGARLDYEERATDMGAAFATFICSTDTTTLIYATYCHRAPESIWPPDFAMAVQQKMEAVFLAGIAEQRQEGERREVKGELKERRARMRDARSSTASDPSEWDLTIARRRSSRWDIRRA